MTFKVIHEFNEEPGAYAYIIYDPVFVVLGPVLHMIYVPPERRGQGVGRKLLERAIAWADEQQLTLTLAPVPDKDCPIDVDAWYRRHDFTPTHSGAMLERMPPTVQQLVADVRNTIKAMVASGEVSSDMEHPYTTTSLGGREITIRNYVNGQYTVDVSLPENIIQLTVSEHIPT